MEDTRLRVLVLKAREPTGGYLPYSTMACACSAVLVMGTTMIRAPASRAPRTWWRCPSGTRAKGTAPSASAAKHTVSTRSKFVGACSISTQTASKPTWAARFAIAGEPLFTPTPRTRRGRPSWSMNGLSGAAMIYILMLVGLTSQESL